MLACWHDSSSIFALKTKTLLQGIQNIKGLDVDKLKSLFAPA